MNKPKTNFHSNKPDVSNESNNMGLLGIEIPNKEKDGASHTNSSSKVSIKMKFRPSHSLKEDKMGVIYIQFIQERKISKINTPYHIFLKEWDKSKGQLIISDEDSTRGTELRVIEANIKWDLVILEQLRRTKNYNAEALIAAYHKFKSPGEKSLFEYIRKLIKKLKEEERFSTASAFQSTLNSFLRFRNGIDISFEMLNREIVEDYQRYLKDRNLSINTISFYMRKLRTAYNKAVLESLCPDIKPFSTVFTGNAPTKKRALNKNTLQKIAMANLSDAPKLEFARDIFLLSLYLQGISFIDLVHIPHLSDDIELITYCRNKTGTPISILLENEAKEIINKYKRDDSSYMLPIITSSDKKTARQQCTNALARINYALKKLVDRLGLNIHLTTYVARHSWATLALANGANINTISMALGHKDLKTTRIYIDSIHSDAVTKANRSVISALKEDIISESK